MKTGKVGAPASTARDSSTTRAKVSCTRPTERVPRLSHWSVPQVRHTASGFALQKHVTRESVSSLPFTTIGMRASASLRHAERSPAGRFAKAQTVNHRGRTCTRADEWVCSLVLAPPLPNVERSGGLSALRWWQRRPQAAATAEPVATTILSGGGGGKLTLALPQTTKSDVQRRKVSRQPRYMSRCVPQVGWAGRRPARGSGGLLRAGGPRSPGGALGISSILRSASPSVRSHGDVGCCEADGVPRSAVVQHAA